MSWNYRICKETYKTDFGEEIISFSLREVYYNNEGNIIGVTSNAVGLVADSVEEFSSNFDKVKEAINKEVIDLDTLVFERDD